MCAFIIIVEMLVSLMRGAFEKPRVATNGGKNSQTFINQVVGYLLLPHP